MWVMISSIFGVLGFIISLINIISYFVSHRINVEIKITELVTRPYVGDKERVIVHYQVNNKSHLPITITDMQLVIDEQNYCEDYNTHEILSYKHTAKGVNEYVPTYNEHLPINLPMLSSHAGYIVFPAPEGTSKGIGKSPTFEIRTNRCKVVKKTFELNEWVAIRRILRNG